MKSIERGDLILVKFYDHFENTNIRPITEVTIKNIGWFNYETDKYLYLWKMWDSRDGLTHQMGILKSEIIHIHHLEEATE